MKCTTACCNYTGRKRTLGKEQGECREITAMPREQRMWRGSAKQPSDMGIRYLTVYAFSTENWNRPQK